MKKEYLENEARVKAEAYCVVAERCRSEVAIKLDQWSVSTELVDRIICHLEKEGYVDNLRYAKAFVRDKYRFNQWGRIKIAQALRMKQIASDQIVLALDEIDEEEYQSVLDILIRKKQKGIKSSNDYERNGKLIRFALGRGYEMDEILRSLKRMGYGDID